MLKKFLRTSVFWFLIALVFGTDAYSTGVCGDPIIEATWARSEKTRYGGHGVSFVNMEDLAEQPVAASCYGSIGMFMLRPLAAFGGLGTIAGAIGTLYGPQIEDGVISSVSTLGSLALAAAIMTTFDSVLRCIPDMTLERIPATVNVVVNLATPSLLYACYGTIVDNLISFPCPNSNSWNPTTCHSLSSSVKNICGGLFITAGVGSLKGISGIIYSCCNRSRS